MFGIPAGFIIGAVLIELALLRISAAGGLTRDVPALILTLIWAQTIYIVTVYLVWREKGRKPPVLFIIGVALAFRCTVWPLTSPLSTDLYRYRWEGQVQHNGGNPYSERPGDPEWIGLRDSVWSEVGQKDVRAGYGPAWELISAGMYRLASWLSPDPRQQVFWFKLPAALSDLGLLGVLWATLRSRDLPTELLLIYAWSPLPVWEFWASGHNDAPVILCISIALLTADSRKWLLASAFVGIAAALKIWPVLLLPALLIKSRRWHVPVVAAGVFLCFAFPYRTDVLTNVRYMSGFVGGWRNNDSLFSALLWFGGSPSTAKYMAFALISAATLWFALHSGFGLLKAWMWTIVSLLLLSSNCHPWYLTWFAPFLIFEPVAPLLLWAGLMPLTYSVWIEWSILGRWDGSAPVRWLVYVPFLTFLLCWVGQKIRESKDRGLHLR